MTNSESPGMHPTEAGLPEGEYRVTWTHPLIQGTGYEPERRDVKLVVGETAELSFLMPQDAELTLTAEQGFGTKRPNPSIFNGARFTLLHHLHADEKRHLFSRIWEHIEPGGVFLLADYFRPAMDRLSELYSLPAEPDPHEAEHDHPDTAAEHLSWLVAAGFAAVDVVWKTDDVGVIVAWRAER